MGLEKYIQQVQNSKLRLKKEVTDYIKTNPKDVHEIENQLHILTHPHTREEFNLLRKYYKKINKEGAKYLKKRYKKLF